MRYLFDEFELDCEKRELMRSGDVLAVEPQVFSLLIHLLGNHDRVVSKDELIEVVWDGRFVSDSAVSSRIKSARKALGDSGRIQKYIKTVHGRGFRFVAKNIATEGSDQSPAPDDKLKTATQDFVFQDIRFCRSADGTKIAHAVAGKGAPLVKTSNWLNHLEFDWQSPVWKHVYSDLMQDHRLIRYDARGNGLSDWDVSDFSLERQLEDLEAVIDAAGVKRFPLLGMSQGCAISAAYAARHPDKVTKLILVGGYATGWNVNRPKSLIEENRAMVTLIRTGWGSNNAAFRQLFTSLFMPDAPPESQHWFNELQRITTSPKNAAGLLETLGKIDVREQLANVRAPTLVIHSRGDSRVPIEAGRELAVGIKDARFVTLDTNNHLIPQSDPAWEKCAAAINAFLAEKSD